MFALSRYFILTLTACAAFSVTAGAAQAKPAKLKLTPQVSSAEVGDYQTFKVSGATRRCQVKMGSHKLHVSFSKRRVASFSWEFYSTGINRFKVTCGSKKLSFAVSVSEPSSSTPTDPGSGGGGGSPAPKPAAPRLTGSDAEAEAWWQSTRPRFTDLSHGWCSDYAYYKRPDIPERIEKWAYKQWVADGTPYIDIRDGQRKSMNDRAEPTPDRFGIAREQGVDMPEYPYLGSYAARPDAPVSFLVAAKRAGFTVDRTPHPGDWEVTPGHMAYVESVSADGLHYQVTEMGASNPGIIFHRTERADWGNINNSTAYFVG